MGFSRMDISLFLDGNAAWLALAGSILGIFASHLPGRIGALFGLPGTFVHESSHWIAALLVGAHPGLLSLIPRERDGYLVRGYVRVHRLGWFSVAPVALAPLPGGLFLAWWAFEFALAPGQSSALALAWGYLAGSCVWACTPSRSDCQLALSKPLGLIPVAAGVGALIALMY